MDLGVKIKICVGKTLGTGAYGKVYRAMYGQLPCAAKLLHETMFQYDDPGIDKFAKRFEQECQLSSTQILSNKPVML